MWWNHIPKLSISTNCWRRFLCFHWILDSSALRREYLLLGGMPTRDSFQPNAIFSNALHLTRNSSQIPDVAAAGTLHSVAVKTGSVSDMHTSTSLLTIYAKAGDLGSSKALFSDIATKDLVAWNAMINAYLYNYCFKAALVLFREMMQVTGEFDSTTLLIVLSALSRSGNFKQCCSLHGASLKLGLDRSDSFLANALTDMYAKWGHLNSAKLVFQTIEFRDTTSWNSMMGGYLYNGSPEKTLSCLKEMILSGTHADAVSLSSSISACSCLENVSTGESVHGWGIKSGFEETSYLSIANALISLYLQYKDFKAAEKIFGRLKVRDAVSWNAMIGGFAEKGKVSEALDLLREMQLKQRIHPDLVTSVSLLPLCAEHNLLKVGRSIHGFTIRRGSWLDLVLTNSLMDMYAKCNELRYSEILFEVMPRRDLISWNTIIAGYSGNGYLKEAHILFRELLHLDMQCSVSTILAILPSCNCQEALKFGESIHCWIMKSGFSDCVLVVNSLMFMYIKCGGVVASFSLFQSISTMADADSWNTIIVGCMQNGYLREALETFSLMHRTSPVNPDPITMVSILSAYGNVGLSSHGKAIHGYALKTLMAEDLRVRNSLITMYCRCGETESAGSVFWRNRFDQNLCSWNCMISGLVQNKEGRKALELFQEMEMNPNEITIVSILTACTQLGALRHGREINGYAYRLGIHHNAYVSASLVDLYSKCGRLELSVRVFQNSMEKSVASWNSMISAYGFHGHGKEAIEQLDEMCRAGNRPTESTFISVLSACSHSGMVEEGHLYYSQMTKKFGLTPTDEHHVYMVDMLGRAGRISEAYEFIKQLPTEPTAGVWGALLSACKDHGDLEMGKAIAERLFCLEPENAGYLVSLSNMYAAVEKWVDVIEIRRMVQDMGLKKPPGCSFLNISYG